MIGGKSAQGSASASFAFHLSLMPWLGKGYFTIVTGEGLRRRGGSVSAVGKRLAWDLVLHLTPSLSVR